MHLSQPLLLRTGLFMFNVRCDEETNAILLTKVSPFPGIVLCDAQRDASPPLIFPHLDLNFILL